MSDTQSLNTEQLNELLKKNGLSIITNTGDAGAGDAAGVGDAGAGDAAGTDDTGAVKVDDLIAERDSLKAELDQIKQEQKLILTELKKTKEVNFTLARQSSVNKANKSPEELINEMF